MTNEAIVEIGAGSIGLAIARRVSAAKTLLVADLRIEAVDAAARVLTDAGIIVKTMTVDGASRSPVTALAAMF